MQTQVEEKTKTLIWEGPEDRQLLSVYEEPPIETEYIPYRPRVSILPAIPAEDLREAVSTITDTTGKVIAWTGYIVIRLGAVLILVAAVALKAVAVTLKAFVGLLFSAMASAPAREDVDWGPAPDYSAETRGTRGAGGSINVTVNVQNNRING